MNEELELYKLIMIPEEDDISISYVDEFGWVTETEFCVWISYAWIEVFINRLEEIFGECIFDDGGFSCNVQSGGVCIDLCEAIGFCFDVETLFPKDKYKH